MSTQTKTVNAGPVGLKPKGDYSASATYTLLDCVMYDHDSWVCKAMNAQGEAVNISGQTPSAGSQYWQKLTDGGKAAYEQSGYAKTQGDYAKAQGDDAKEKAANAQYQAGQAESAASKAANVNAYMVDYELKVTDRNGHTSSTNVKGDKGEGINYNTLTTAQKQELAGYVVRQVTSENILGPQYDSNKRCISYPTTSGVKYDEGTRSIKIL